MEKPISNMRNPAPTMDSGTPTAGTRAARSEPSDRKITSSTTSTASTRVLKTSRIDSSMKALPS